MKLEEALDIVYQLADQNVLSADLENDEEVAELERQSQALDMVYDLLELLKRQ